MRRCWRRNRTVGREVIFLRKATKELKKLPSVEQIRIVERVEAYAADADNPPHAVLALGGEKPTCRL
jgi:mRNA-degrading endonuclease RelE of RelBE toxin-antitoxin system